MKVRNTDKRLIKNENTIAFWQKTTITINNLHFRKNRNLPDFSLLGKVAQKDIPANAVGTLGLQGCF